MHGALGPNCAVASVTPTSALILCASQAPYILTRASVAGALGLPQNSVRVELYPFSGNYGHNTYDDVSISAALMSQAVGKPVRVQFMRWDEHGWDQFGPAGAAGIHYQFAAGDQNFFVCQTYALSQAHGLIRGF